MGGKAFERTLAYPEFRHRTALSLLSLQLGKGLSLTSFDKPSSKTKCFVSTVCM